jgi:integrase
MYPVATYLARRPAETVKIYKRGLQMFADHVNVPLDQLHTYIESPKEKIIGDLLTFGDTLAHLNQNSQRVYISSLMAYLSYNEITIPRAQRSHVVPKKGDLFRDRAMTLEEVRKIHEFLSPIGRAALLLMFSTGMRISEIIAFKENDIEGQIIHLKNTYCKGGKGRDVVMSNECLTFLNDIWLPQKPEYLSIAVMRNIGLQDQNKTPEKSAGEKSLNDDRVIPCSKATLYEIMMRGFRRAGFGEKRDGKCLYHPHGLRKSFRSIVGSNNPDLAELLMGHNGYLSSSYVRLDIVKEYQKIEHLLSMGATEGLTSKMRLLEDEVKAYRAKFHEIEQRQLSIQTATTAINTALTPEQRKAFLATASKEEILQMLSQAAESK